MWGFLLAAVTASGMCDESFLKLFELCNHSPRIASDTKGMKEAPAAHRAY